MRVSGLTPIKNSGPTITCHPLNAWQTNKEPSHYLNPYVHSIATRQALSKWVFYAGSVCFLVHSIANRQANPQLNCLCGCAHFFLAKYMLYICFVYFFYMLCLLNCMLFVYHLMLILDTSTGIKNPCQTNA
jgi:hypothetical protein